MEAETDCLVFLFFDVFFRMRFCMDIGLFFGVSKPEKSIKTDVFSMVFVNSLQNQCFRKRFRQSLMFVSCLGVKTTKNREHIVLKIVRFCSISSFCFFLRFWDCGWIFGSP